MLASRTRLWRALALTITLAACGHAPAVELQTASVGRVRVAEANAVPPSTAAPISTTSLPSPSTLPHPAPSHAVRSGPRPTVVVDVAFWRRVANCECSSGHCSGIYIGFFQFSRDTAAKVGIDGSESYEEQRDAAIVWLGMIHGNGGGRSGWPVCWWVAMRG